MSLIQREQIVLHYAQEPDCIKWSNYQLVCNFYFSIFFFRMFLHLTKWCVLTAQSLLYLICNFQILKYLCACTSIISVFVFVCVRAHSRVLSELGIWVFATIYSRDARHFEYISLQLGSHSGLGRQRDVFLFFFTCGSRVLSMQNTVV